MGKEAKMREEEERVLKTIRQNMERGDGLGEELGYHRPTKTIRPMSNAHDPDEWTRITQQDLEFAAATKGGEEKMIVMPGKLLQEQAARGGTKDVFFLCRSDDDVYDLVGDGDSTGVVPGTLYWAADSEKAQASAVGKEGDQVRVIIHCPDADSGQSAPLASIKVTGYVLHGVEWREVPVKVLPVRSAIFSRIDGLFQTDVVAEKRVLTVGVGSIGSAIVMYLAKSGVTKFDLIDGDRVDLANVVRHEAGVSRVGEYKTKVMAELIMEKNPYAEVHTWEENVRNENREEVRKIVQKVEIVICATDNRESRLIINRVCVEENKPCIFAGAFRRAYGGQILFIHPHVSLCYQCFCRFLPEQAGDQEISSPEQAASVAYGGPPEPGLSTDLAPLSTMAVKLAVQELLKGAQTTLRSLDEDLVAPWYLWLNRREPGTQFEKLEPLGFSLGLRILRWYGIKVDRDPACPVCGDFEGELVREKGLQLPDDR
jgi:molybdopterin/thiamine biosynthesis adenylyltransferase